ncbi:MAG: sugar phosphate isomerase/epimerase [Cyclobacteriaceae bacterium]|nr:sugar phosphate isomerase/epimerase [Cyclobacteriaceae bacterium]
MLDLGFVSAVMAEKSFEEVITFASENRFKCVEIMCWPRGKAERRYAGVTHINVDELDDRKTGEIKNFLREKGVYISSLGYYPNALDPDLKTAETAFEHIRKVIEASAKLEIGTMTTFIGRDPSRTVEDNLAMFREKWPPVIAYAEKMGINIGIENCPMIFTRDEWPGGKNLATTPDIWDKMFNIIPNANFGLNYDPSHFIWQHMDEVQPIYDFKDRLHHIHLKDVKIHRDKLNRFGIMGYPNQYHSPKIPGLGDVRWSYFFSALTDVGYRGPCCVEVEDRSFEGSDESVKTSLLQSRNYLNQFFIL